MKLIFISFLFFSATIITFSQTKRANIWYFGNNAGLDFNFSPPQPLFDGQLTLLPPGPTAALEGSASISDENGNLLFYTNGKNIWDRSHNLMPNANGSNPFTEWNKMLTGNTSIAQSAIITPVLGNPSRYYIFTTDGSSNIVEGPLGNWDGLNYTVIDMTLNNGFGDIDTAYIHSMGYLNENKIVLVDSTTEKIAVARHINGIDYWVLTRTFFKDEIHAFLVTCDGVSNTAIISTLNNTYNPSSGYPISQQNAKKGRGYLLSSLDGKELTEADVSGSLMHYNFDNSNGSIISEDTMLWLNGNVRFGPSDFIYGIAYSENDSIIYATYGKKRPSQSVDSVFILAFNRYSLPISSSLKIAFADSFKKFSVFTTAIQLAPDGNIYHGYKNSTKIGVIKNANSYNSASYFYDSVDLGGQISSSGLPGFYYYKDFQYQLPDSQMSICPGMPVNIGLPNEPLFSYNWSPASGLSDSTIANPIASPIISTTYYLAIQGCITDSITILVKDTQHLVLELGADTIICFNNIYIMNAETTGAYRYLWSTGDTTTSIKVLETLSFWLMITDSSECLSERDTIEVAFNQPIEIIKDNDTLLCMNSSLSLSASKIGVSYNWQPTNVFKDNTKRNPIINPKQTVIISLTMIDSNQCIHVDSLNVEVLPCDVFIPNAFSPNGDGYNDVFTTRGDGIETFTMIIFDRWGNKIFTTESLNQGWDGTNKKGVIANNGVYVYYLKVSFIDGEDIMRKGNVTLVK